ncbi:hypothetical protein [Sphingorhabdus sp. Alg231-15]|uniref:hypothetical protein n=1 Tax=Sphingorhabdus sp. Alg231-15 TaxID=1922222 RepID=UPI000D54C3B3
MIWAQILQNIKLSWHFGFYGKHAERMLEGREREYLDQFWNEFSANRAAMTEDKRKRYSEYYMKPGALHGALSHFSTFEQDAEDNCELAKRKLELPIIGIGGSHSLAGAIGEHADKLSKNATSEIIEGAGH